MKFFVGLHHPADLRHFSRACISINVVRGRKSALLSRDGAEVLLDSGAFTEISTHGRYRHSVEDYAAQALKACGQMPVAAIVSQDYMCEPFIVAKTGLSIREHQDLTIERYIELRRAMPSTKAVLPVLQGYQAADYRRHVRDYGALLHRGMWVGVGSVCKRNSSPVDVVNVLEAIHAERPDLKLHGFGIKKTALLEPRVRQLLYSADSMAWSFAARREGRDPNDWREAARFVTEIESAAARPIGPTQRSLELEA